ncbi:hypothetical protein SAMN04487972_10396 [Paracoccus halophilus]|uniref:Membrane protein n=1 Tax=Paracoccus halophilus TaxID=376733 RepID=A0A099F4E6_9RHOB|nr:aminoacetone oxidase family FAD-binding enzyme [Paracoccus halophilus]KGJ05168.1 membrane protein [Paracoccus halophilus]SFA43779.1 hypothetical protein SAMN04487972_10396 [Paracoccus halophilus]
MEAVDIVILGAGAAGLFCAGSILGEGGGAARVLVLDHARAPGEKIRISGGGRCNFTNLATERDRFLSRNPRFCASALAGFRATDFVAMVDRAGIAWHEKTLGQLFCDGSARQIIDMLLHRMRGAELRLETAVQGVSRQGDRFIVATSAGPISARHVVVATGGKSIPKMGATGIGYEIARSFGLDLVEPRAGLVPLTFAQQDLDLCRPLAGLSVIAEVSHGAGKRRASFRDGLLFTHRGLSGPAILQISSYWQPGEMITADLVPGVDIAAALRDQRGQGGRISPAVALTRWLPARLADAIAAVTGLQGARLADQGNAALDRLGARINRWALRPVGSEGWRTAEVTLGGLDTAMLHSHSMEVRSVPGLYFIGEVVDVTGWLGGYNFQWAWASAHAAARAIVAPPA